MKILWLCNIMLPKIAEHMNKPVPFVGGWLTGLSDDILKTDENELCVVFPMVNEAEIISGNAGGMKYYGFPQKQTDATKYNPDIEIYLEEILTKENPDIVHIFGTEYPQSLSMMKVCEKLNIENKAVINIQGLCHYYEMHNNAYLPHKILKHKTFRDFLKNENIYKQAENFGKRGKFEVEAIKKVRHVIGRTDWDKAATKLINPDVNYHFCNETLRNEFYNHEWDIEKIERHSLFLGQSQIPIKGFHLLLEAVSYIKKRYPDVHIYTTGKDLFNLSAEWKLRSTSYQKYILKLIKKYDLQNNVTFLGGLSEKEMCMQYLKTHVFVSPSSIENESNVLSEAKILGVPCVASFAGGVSNRIEHKTDGFIYQPDAPYMLAYYIMEIFSDDNLAKKFSGNARQCALKTHNHAVNLETMLNIYRQIINTKN